MVLDGGAFHQRSVSHCRQSLWNEASAGSDGVFLVAGLGPGFPILRFDETGVVTWIKNAASDSGIYENHEECPAL